MDEVDDERRRELEDAYDRKSDPLLSAAFLILGAHDELLQSAGPLEQELRSHLGELFEGVWIQVLHRLEASLTTTSLAVADLRER